MWYDIKNSTMLVGRNMRAVNILWPWEFSELEAELFRCDCGSEICHGNIEENISSPVFLNNLLTKVLHLSIHIVSSADSSAYHNLCMIVLNCAQYQWFDRSKVQSSARNIWKFDHQYLWLPDRTTAAMGAYAASHTHTRAHWLIWRSYRSVHDADICTRWHDK